MLCVCVCVFGFITCLWLGVLSLPFFFFNIQALNLFVLYLLQGEVACFPFFFFKYERKGICLI